VAWAEGLKTLTVAHMVKKFPHIRDFLTSMTIQFATSTEKYLTTIKCILKLSIPRIFCIAITSFIHQQNTHLQYNTCIIIISTLLYVSVLNSPSSRRTLS
jgi:hypothetical protein